ncbi:hypothetical protein [Algoriphagus chordae]|uniref:Sulfite dehydrogenase (Cytochrome) subunit SorB n=1 Tax=Algoriphagus chordae TaxID=237019 RepID=A0A2W7QRI8_9BACT|nr:hypothetical protein [Algoriphagus chordae]PZX50601.1 hypothetical protein LV85_02708 [Algoriphagus chordae]
MNNSAKNKSTRPKKETLQLFNVLIKSTIGILVLVVLLVGLVLAIVFQPEISALQSADATEAGESVASQEEPLDQLVDGKDVATGLIAGEGLELVKASCTACHSSALILQNRFTREGWHSKIVWMQETQGLWDLGDNESKILDYLAEHYAPEEAHGRRAPLSNIDWYELKD